MMELVRKGNSTYNQTSRNLEILVRANLVIVKRFGRLKVVELNTENEKTQVLLKALHMLSRADFGKGQRNGNVF
jgi:hypothetical protein